MKLSLIKQVNLSFLFELIKRPKRSSILSLVLLSYTVLATAEEVVEYRNGVMLGQGYNSLTGEFMTPCFTGEVKPTFYNITKGKFLWEEVESLEDINKGLSISVSAAYKGLNTGGEGKVSYLNSYKASSNNVAVLARIKIETGSDALVSARLRGEISAEISNRGKINQLALREKCGTHYVQSLTVGGELYATLEQSVRSEGERSDFQAVVSVSGGVVNASTETSTSIEQSRFNRSVKIKGGYTGGKSITPSSVSELKDEFKTMRGIMNELAAEEAKTKTRKAAPIEAVLIPIIPVGIDVTKLVNLDIALTKERAIKTYLTKIHAIASNPTLYNVDRTTLQTRSRTIDEGANKLLISLRQQMNACAQSNEKTMTKACNFAIYPVVSLLNNDIPKLFQATCDQAWQPPEFTSQFSAIEHVRDDYSMGGDDTIQIETRYNGDSMSGLSQSTRLYVYEASHRTAFQREVKREFFNPNSAPAPACYLNGPVHISEAPGSINVGRAANNYMTLDFNTTLVASASCRTNQTGEDRGYVGCNQISFKPITIPIEHIEKLIGFQPSQLKIPDWLP